MARTTKELIDELEAEGSCFAAAFLVCRFVTHTEYAEYVGRAEVDNLARLNGIVAGGGIPFAIVGYSPDENGSTLSVYSRLLKEYEADDEALSFLQRTLPIVVEGVRKSGLIPQYLPLGQWPHRDSSKHPDGQDQDKSAKPNPVGSEAVDTVEEASLESFPASDSPAWKSDENK